jgi:hypothetical protein
MTLGIKLRALSLTRYLEQESSTNLVNNRAAEFRLTRLANMLKKLPSHQGVRDKELTSRVTRFHPVARYYYYYYYYYYYLIELQMGSTC